nr:immunoglobulin heavy chain junction region [Macaca mulatta]MOX61423.1 immunoglobulin heavy chain junction region [Macaca mulatta]MOX63250.1 immunoglobulin heavy chain junction region [Macaca mulatta]MOX63755.1 immunoglobulin heavy chain junction region [Macaca mulatta]MOX64607.1 immunoglobulin heavy chain junction region [Macaca mulatta]
CVRDSYGSGLDAW